MGQTEIIIDLMQGQLLPQALLALAERADPPSPCRHVLADGQVEALYERGVDLAAKGSQYGIDGLQGAKHHAVPHPHQAPPAYGLDHLRVEQLRLGHPTRLRCGACDLAPWWLHPGPI